MKKLRKLQQYAFRREFSEEQMRAYFTKDDTNKKRLLVVTTALGILSLCICYANLFIWKVWVQYSLNLAYAAGIFLLIALIVWVILKLGIEVPTDKEYDSWVQEKAGEYLRRALRKINQDGLSEEEIDEIPFIHGFVLRGTNNAKNYRTRDIYWKKGKDGIQRYSINVFRYFLPVEHQLVVFIIDINAVNHRDRREQIHEYFFNDVVAVATEEEFDQIGENEYLTQSFTLRISDGKPISATIRSQPLDHEQKLEEYKLPSSSNVDNTIATLRMFMRTYKQK